ncbi:hypothetical protein [Streptomyces sp. NBC_00582]|uniref:hypothetical protein n=1 Tax=Streptomyces sp. NBC_00582 TaxID=2975783 RepID=UPI002E820690|nr:hypothetical protein [Streptomyces sp. NBC_00582]WUB64452.1 hypothetical protein OG852_30690 [Streptomyces sp. NBC_00582]
MERTQSSPPPEAPSPLARYGRGQAHVDAQVRTMLGEIAERLERNRPDQPLTATARIAVLQATTMDPVLSRALNLACPEITGHITRTAYAARLREIKGGGEQR